MKKTIKILLAIAGIGIIVGGIVGYSFYNKIYKPNIYVDKTKYLFIADGSDFKTVKDSLYSNFKIIDKNGFEWTAEKKKYPQKIRGGKYKITDGMNNNQLVNMLRAGMQEPVRVTFNNLRTINQLCSKISKQINVDSSYLFQLLSDDKFMSKYGFNSVNCNAMFIPDTYEFYWNTSAEKFIDKMYDLYKKYWTEERKTKAKAMNLTELEISTLASIVQSEQAVHKEEQPIIAGLYLNRLKIGMPLQSCPTLIYAIGDFSIKRVTEKLIKSTDSPYNTYVNTGLPPSPINFPEVSALDAVLNYKPNDYIYMCAKSDLSGYHNFSRNYDQHLKYAKDYQKMLDSKGIK
ncbi:MAG: endolytic transglycosylase MltG [Bacteroidales bacterium]|nr:endolytic transglycosylase MltG [Bacteroidales bacterium]